MQISTAAQASKKLPLEGSCSLHSKCPPAWKGCGPPAEKYCRRRCEPAARCQSWQHPGGMLWRSSLRAMRFAGHLGWGGRNGGSLFPELFLEGVLCLQLSCLCGFSSVKNFLSSFKHWCQIICTFKIFFIGWINSIPVSLNVFQLLKSKRW